jgi:hypothetical protein
MKLILESTSRVVDGPNGPTRLYAGHIEQTCGGKIACQAFIGEVYIGDLNSEPQIIAAEDPTDPIDGSSFSKSEVITQAVRSRLKVLLEPSMN